MAHKLVQQVADYESFLDIRMVQKGKKCKKVKDKSKVLWLVTHLEFKIALILILLSQP